MLIKINNNQRGRPHGLIGLYALNKMRYKHDDVFKYASSLFDIKPSDSIIDIGCGPGEHIKKMEPLALLSYGVDISPLSIKMTARANRRAIRAGRLKLIEGNIKDINIANIKFNIATAYCTVGFWEDLEGSFRAIYNILAINGSLIIAGHKNKEPDTLIDTLKKVGFSPIKYITDDDLYAIKADKQKN